MGEPLFPRGPGPRSGVCASAFPRLHVGVDKGTTEGGRSLASGSVDSPAAPRVHPSQAPAARAQTRPLGEGAPRPPAPRQEHAGTPSGTVPTVTPQAALTASGRASGRPVVQASAPLSPQPRPRALVFLPGCGGCGTEIRNGQSLVALDKHWHLGCFKCKTCGKQLNAEYISK